MAKRKRKRTYRKPKPSVTGLLSLATLALPAVEALTSSGSMENKTSILIKKYTGYDRRDNSFDFMQPVRTYGAAVVPLAAKKAIRAVAGGTANNITRGLPVSL